MIKSSIIRQVVDLQKQAERLIRTGGNLQRLKHFLNIMTIIIGLFTRGLSTAYNERDKIERALEHIKEISNKYSSYEMMIRNCFDN